MKQQSSRKITRIFWLLIVGLVSVNILLLWQNRKMRTQLSKRQPEKLEIGDFVHSFTAKDLKGETVSIDFSDKSKKRVFLYFTPTCLYCKQQFPEWKELLFQAKDKNVQVLGIVNEDESKETIEKYLNSFNCGMNSENPLQVLFVPEEILQKYKLNLTPTTVLLSADGRVEQYWLGKWKDADKIHALNLNKN